MPEDLSNVTVAGEVAEEGSSYAWAWAVGVVIPLALLAYYWMRKRKRPAEQATGCGPCKEAKVENDVGVVDSHDDKEGEHVNKYAWNVWRGDKLDERRMGGIDNTGNSCYMNSALQLLFAARPFAYTYVDSGSEILLHKPNKFNSSLVKLVREMDEGTGRYKTQHAFRRVASEGHPEFSAYGQQDALEYFLHMLVNIQENFPHEMSGRNPCDHMRIELCEQIQRGEKANYVRREEYVLSCPLAEHCSDDSSRETSASHEESSKVSGVMELSGEEDIEKEDVTSDSQKFPHQTHQERTSLLKEYKTTVINDNNNMFDEGSVTDDGASGETNCQENSNHQRNIQDVTEPALNENGGTTGKANVILTDLKQKVGGSGDIRHQEAYDNARAAEVKSSSTSTNLSGESNEECSEKNDPDTDTEGESQRPLLGHINVSYHKNEVMNLPEMVQNTTSASTDNGGSTERDCLLTPGSKKKKVPTATLR